MRRYEVLAVSSLRVKKNAQPQTKVFPIERGQCQRKSRHSTRESTFRYQVFHTTRTSRCERQVLTSWVSFMKERGDHFPKGVKMFFPFKAPSVNSMFTVFTRQAAVNATT